MQKLTESESKTLKLRVKTLKLIEENINVNIHNLGFGNNFLDMTPKLQQQQQQRDKLDLIKIGNFLHQRIRPRKWKEHTGWEKVFANHIIIKGLIYKTFIRTLTTEFKNEGRS